MRLLALMLLLVASSVSAQPMRVTEVIGRVAEVHDVASDRGRTYLATSGGLVVRDGNGQRVLTPRDGIVGTRVRSVSITASGIWVGSIEGVTRLDPESLRVIASLPHRRVQRVVEWSGAVWLVGYQGLTRISGQESRTISLGRSHARTRLTDALVVNVASGSRQELWVASAGAGILRVAADGTLLGRIHRGLPDATVWDLHQDQGRVLAATLEGLAVIEGPAVTRGHALSRAASRMSIRDIRGVTTHEGQVFVATFGGGVHRLGARPRAVGRASNALALASTHEGLIVGHTSGAQRKSGTRLEAIAGGGLPSADITALERAFGRMWIGTFDGGLAQMRNGRIEAVRRAADRWNVDARINDLAVTRRPERLWIATDRGLYWHDGRRFAQVEDPQAPARVHVTSLHVDAQGSLWVTSSRQLSRWNAEGWQSWGGDPRFPLMQLHAVTTHGDEVWVGSLHGLFRFDPSTGRYERHTVSSGDLPVDWVTALVRVNGALVAGTYHGGLAWRRRGRFQIEREADGLPAGWVNPHAMRVIEGQVWIGTLERGLVVGRAGRWSHLTMSDGLPSDDVTDFLPDSEGVWVSTRGGLARIALR